jgi:RNA polymerase sigma-70 factor (ECF subfamily)
VLYIGGEILGQNFLSKTEKEFKEVYQRNIDIVFRLCYVSLNNFSDAEDATQCIFLKFLNSNVIFNDLEHEKAWFIVTTRNYCRDILKSWWKSRRIDLKSLPEISYWDDRMELSNVFEKLLALPEKYKTVLYLYYFEEYTVREISNILKRKESTIQTQLSRGRKLLKIDLGGNYIE